MKLPTMPIIIQKILLLSLITLFHLPLVVHASPHQLLQGHQTDSRFVAYQPRSVPGTGGVHAVFVRSRSRDEEAAGKGEEAY